jgi:hypothetical protein
MEYQINVKYKPSQGPKVEVQISAIGPVGRTRADVEQAVQERIDTGNSPRDWIINIVQWERYGRQFFGNDESAWRQLRFFFGEREIDEEEE